MYGHAENDVESDDWQQVGARRGKRMSKTPNDEDSQSFFTSAFGFGSHIGVAEPWQRMDPWSHITDAPSVPAERNPRLEAARQRPEVPQWPARQANLRANAGNDNPRQRCREGQDHWQHSSGAGQDADRKAPSSCPRRPPRRPVPDDRCEGCVDDRKVRVKNLTLRTTESQVREAFNDAIPQQFTVQETKLATDASGNSKGFAFVTFNCPDAAVYVRQLTIVLDSKPCLVVPYRSREDVGKQALSAGCGPDAGRVDLRTRVNEFVNRYELPKDLRELFAKCKAEPAARAVEKLEGSRALSSQTPQKIAEIVKSELIDAKRRELPRCVQLNADRWVQNLKVESSLKCQVMDYFHDRSAEEVEYVIHEEGDWFERSLPRQRDPVQWLTGEVKKHMQKKLQKLTDDFCRKFRLDEDMVQRLNRLNEIGQRNVMKKWECAGSWWDVEGRLKALLDDEERYRQSKQQKSWSSKAPTVPDKKKIEEDSSSASEDEKEAKNGMTDKLVLESLQKTAKQSSKMLDSPAKVPRSSNEINFVRSAQDWLRKSKQEKRIEGCEESVGDEGRSKRRKKPRPTHYIICVDASGSMMLNDCCSTSGQTVTRLDAVMEQCRSFMRESSLNSEDIYSFLTFNEDYVIHFAGLSMQEAQMHLGSSKPKAEKQTLYSQGLEGVKRAIRQEGEQKPALVVFFSDGEPTDDGDFMQVLNKLRSKYETSPGLKFYTAGCGQGEKFEHLQQMASISGGAFNNCGVSTTSIRNAFSAISSSISRSRENESKDMESYKQKTSCRASTLEQIQEDAPSGSSKNCVDNIDFEDSRPTEIYKDPTDLRLWRKLTASQTVYIFDGVQFSRKAFQADVELLLKKQPFTKGGMRVVYGMVEKQEPTSRHVAKRLFRDHMGTSDVQEHHVFAKSSAVAAYYAQLFQLEMDQKGLRPKVDFRFSEVGVYSKLMKDARVDEPFHFCGEKYLPGNWVKFNNNDGYVSEDLSKHSAVAQAFSHFTFERSGHKMMVVDVQGVVKEKEKGKDATDATLVFKLTDPQVHCSSKWKRKAQGETIPERFGKGDFREDGFSAFFQRHVCGRLCQDLGLREERDAREPTASGYIPAVREYFQEFRTWLSYARELMEWDLNEYSCPQEFDENAYWLPVKIWAKKTNAEEAVQDIQNKVKDILGKNLRKFTVAQTGDKDGSKWTEQMSAWRQRFAATILPWPPGFPQSPLTEIWVIADRKAEQDDVAAVHEEVKEAVDKVAQPAEQAPPCGWQKRFCPTEKDWYFWNKYKTDDAFWPQEGHSAPWSCRTVNGRVEWINQANGRSFFDDEAEDLRNENC